MDRKIYTQVALLDIVYHQPPLISLSAGEHSEGRVYTYWEASCASDTPFGIGYSSNTTGTHTLSVNGILKSADIQPLAATHSRLV